MTTEFYKSSRKQLKKREKNSFSSVTAARVDKAVLSELEKWIVGAVRTFAA